MKRAKEVKALIGERDNTNHCVYFLSCDGVVVYVGQTKNLESRIHSHLMENKKIFDSVTSSDCEKDKARELESHYINSIRPAYNKFGNPDYEQKIKRRAKKSPDTCGGYGLNLTKALNIALAKRDMKKKDLAEQMKVTPSYITQVTKNGALSVSKLQELAGALGFKVWEFIKLGEE